ncbi:hypothetical protein [Microbacterium sp. H1-D42]|uniref:hypothetical protein n=1 Tax=Microbacterium sp. H1-D42 TaxID=2925844 RepID=UPI001F5353F1|nr:hypothetical protein [Microbacterium sp. H1-D42]UNK71759.1 hypothetical protein MNR00_04690 [Microbacterium sp. H1-D42]
MSTVISRAAAVSAGIALIVAPVAAVVLKGSIFPGWMMFVAMMFSPVLLLGWALQIVIAVNAFLRARGVFRRSQGGWRALIAAWLTSVGVLAVAFFLVDGGDDGTYGSAFTELMGTSSTPEGESLSSVIMLACVFVWLTSWLWLVVEWIVQLVQARKRAASLG